ncbi:hypothetical protein PsorP6_002527 [Peronosclerospora sorghi]|uniref:Uncharacterized protein n=1 Tax=Peronosclerospora sorghi TaxID=230839 RepID=A0ACC0WYZ1_9STRA|nr:hypothetical protein PsorP6_002527 [Peronosclerospora sorghi]
MLRSNPADTLSSPTDSSSFSGGNACVSDNIKNKSKSKKKKKKPTTVKTRDETENNGMENKQDIKEDATQLPLARRLEMAASTPDSHSALLGLVGWSRLYMHTETVLCLFQSNALSHLLANVLRSRATAAMLENLETLLANCLSVESTSATGPHRDMAGEVVAAVKAIAEQLQDSADDAGNIEAEAERAAQALSQSICAYALSLHGVDLNSPLTKEIQDLDARIAQMAKKIDAVRAQTIQESFQRRDLRSDALTLHEMRLKKLTALIEERVHDSQDQTYVDDNVDEKKEYVQENIETEDETQMHELTKALQDMQDRKDAELEPLHKKKAEASMEAQSLRRKQEELEAQLLAVKSELQRVVSEEHQADEGIRVVEEQFIADTAQFRTEHQHVMQLFSQAKRRRVIATEVGRVQNNVRQLRLADSQVNSLRAKQTACSLQELESSLTYFESELPCVKFIMSRIEENTTKLAAARSEALSYRTLGVSSVAEQIETKAAELEAYLEEDRTCLSALRKRDEELLSIMRRILTDPSLRDALAGVNEKVRRESQRMIDYVSKLNDSLP